MGVPRIDHVVVDVRERMDEAERRYRALGFHLTERGRHSLGSVNRLAMLDPDYIELLGSGDGQRPDLAGFPIGMNGLVFALEGDAEALHEAQRARGVPAQPVQRFGRPVVLPDGARREARFNVVRLEPRAVFDGRVYFCQHLTPDLVWRPEWQGHANGALALARVVLAVADPDRTAAAFARMFDAGSVGTASSGGGGRVLRAGGVAVEIQAREALEHVLGGAVADPAGRGDHMALLGVRVRSLRRAEEVLRANGVAGVRADARGLLVPAAEAMNVALEFVE
jgi:Glyoxalase-like domain